MVYLYNRVNIPIPQIRLEKPLCGKRHTVNHDISHNTIQTTAPKAVKHTPVELALLGLALIFFFAFPAILLGTPLSAELLTTLSLAAVILAPVCAARMAGGFRPILPYVLLLVLILFTFGTPLAVGLVAAFFAGLCLYAVLLSRYRSPLLGAIPLLAYALCLVITGSFTLSLLALGSLPASLTLAFVLHKRQTRIGSIVRVTTALLATLVVALGAILFFSLGVRSVQELRDWIEQLRTSLIGFTMDALTTALQTVGSQLSEEADSLLGISPATMEQYVTLTVTYVFNLAPAIAVLLANLVSFASHSLGTVLYMASGEVSAEDARRMHLFRMNTASAVIFYVCLLPSLLLTDEYAYLGNAALNLSLIVAPGLCLTAFVFIRMMMASKGPSCLASLLYFAFLILLFTLPYQTLTVCAFAGGVILIRQSILDRKSGKR